MEKTRKSKSVRAVPEGMRTITPYLVVRGAQQLIEFIEKAFDGKVTYRMDQADGKITHATMSIGDSTIMLADATEGMSQQTAMLYLYLDDADSAFEKARESDATLLQEMKTEFYGDRAGALKDKWGNIWWMATHVEDVQDEELQRRAEQEMKKRAQKKDPAHA